MGPKLETQDSGKMLERLAVVETKVYDHVSSCSKESHHIWETMEKNNMTLHKEINKVDTKIDSTMSKINGKFILILLSIIGSMGTMIWKLFSVSYLV